MPGKVTAEEYLRSCCRYFTRYEGRCRACWEEDEDFALLMRLSLEHAEGKEVDADAFMAALGRCRERGYMLHLHKDVFDENEWYYLDQSPLVTLQLGTEWCDLDDVLAAPSVIDASLDSMRGELCYPYPGRDDDWFRARRQEFIVAGTWET